MKTSTPALEGLRLDLGCGPNPREGFEGVDRLAFDGKVKHVVDLTLPWPWSDSSTEEAHCSHFVEHLDSMERCHFVNELYRILVKGGKATIIVPSWSSCRAYGDPTHKWPPVSDFWFYYLDRGWRIGDPKAVCPTCQGKKSTPNSNTCDGCKGLGTISIPGNAPHTDATYLPGGFNCDFAVTWGYNMHPQICMKNQEGQQFALQWYKEAALDIIATFQKK